MLGICTEFSKFLVLVFDPKGSTKTEHNQDPAYKDFEANYYIVKEKSCYGKADLRCATSR